MHDVLVEFNRRPIVSVEGVGGNSGAEARGPRVMAVFAGHERAYSQEPVRDGIHYYVLGPTGAAPRRGEDSAAALRHIMLVKFDSPDAAVARRDASRRSSLWATAGMGEGGAAIVGEDIVTRHERPRDGRDAIAALGKRGDGD